MADTPNTVSHPAPFGPACMHEGCTAPATYQSWMHAARVSDAYHTCTTHIPSNAVVIYELRFPCAAPDCTERVPATLVHVARAGGAILDLPMCNDHRDSPLATDTWEDTWTVAPSTDAPDGYPAVTPLTPREQHGAEAAWAMARIMQFNWGAFGDRTELTVNRDHRGWTLALAMHGEVIAKSRHHSLDRAFRLVLSIVGA